jgi:hypothetical protein
LGLGLNGEKQLLLLLLPAMTGLKPSGVGRLAIEVKAAVPTYTAIVRAGAFKGRLGRPGERALLGGKERKLLNDLIDRKKALRGSRRGGGTFMIRECMVIGHGTVTKRGKNCLNTGTHG